MIPYHGTPIGAIERNADVIRGRNLVLTWTSYASIVKNQNRHTYASGLSTRQLGRKITT